MCSDRFIGRFYLLLFYLVEEKDDNLIKDHFLYKLLEVDTWKPNSTEITLCEKLIARLDEIITCVVSSAVPVTKKDSAALQVSLFEFFQIFGDKFEYLLI